MKKSILPGLCLLVAVTGDASAHMYARAVSMDTSYGYSLYKYEWHADSPWRSAVIKNAVTNWGPWKQYPEETVVRFPVEGWIGPVQTGRWYQTTFYNRFGLPSKTSKTWIAADICGISPERDDP